MFTDYTEITFNWLNSDRASKITTICKSYSQVAVKRVAQERGAIGMIKLLVRVNGISWRESVVIANNIREKVNTAGLSNSITY